ncbi:hypothetical protein [Paenibacillus sp. A3M_27_13]|uniref:hypothetical protein n=1 Tax=Paenibacillus sp. A3M_27_13 TaxID=2962029 RepID=UPI0020B85598|nr:hypothetical protein [Paenibacillus sp. A3M_27_13]MCP3746804.1 hypothetical protein [Paenibacillus sp. A3M_27_13]
MAQPNRRLIQTRQNTERGMGLTETRGVICFKHGVQIKPELWIYAVNMLIPHHTLTFFRTKQQKDDYAFFHNDTRICHIGWVEKVIDNDTVQTEMVQMLMVDKYNVASVPLAEQGRCT